MFWCIPPDVIPLDSFDFTYRVPKWDHDYVHVFKNDDEFNGICLFPKNTSISKKEFENRFFVSKKEIDIQASTIKPYDKFNIDTYQDYLNALQATSTDMFWYIPNDVIPLDSFDFTYQVPKWDHDYVHVFKNNDEFNGICLFPKNKEISKKEFENRFFVSKKEIDIQASTTKPYDKFNITSYNEYLNASQSTSTDMFWCIPPDVIPLDTFDFTYQVPKWDHDFVHVFKNGEHYDGVCLFPKSLTISQREFYHRFFTDKKEIDIVASKPKQYNKYYPSTFKEYQEIIDDMFWLVWPEIIVTDHTIFDLYFSHHNSYDRRENHVFKNMCNDSSSYLSGVILCSKYKPLSEREFNKQYAVDKKEHDAVVSKYQYPVYYIKSYDEYLNIVNTEKQQMFWCQWPNTEILDNTIFDLYFDPNDGKYDHDRKENHVFKNMCNDTESYLSGVTLFSKSKVISKKEFDRKYLIDKKEHNRIVSRYRYSRYDITSYDEYKQLLETETQSMFWGIWPEIDIIDNTIFDLYFDPNDGKYDHDRKENHVFKNLFRGEETYSNGITLFSTNKKIGKREFDHRFLTERKEHDVLSSKFKPYDIVFISYNEPTADINYQRLLSKFSSNKIHRVSGVTGIHAAHLAAAKLSTTPMFWVVDGDAVIEDDFKFDHLVPRYDRYIVHVWHSRNPINDLEYGYGGVKLLPKKQTLEMDLNSTDMTTSISSSLRVMPIVSNITQFNTDAFSTWRSAFRECVKLSSRVILGQQDVETANRLEIWCTVGDTRLYGQYAIAGANAGKIYGQDNANNSSALGKINDFNWLRDQFETSSEAIGNI